VDSLGHQDPQLRPYSRLPRVDWGDALLRDWTDDR
jgi:hypothetical protein